MGPERSNLYFAKLKHKEKIKIKNKRYSAINTLNQANGKTGRITDKSKITKEKKKTIIQITRKGVERIRGGKLAEKQL